MSERPEESVTVDESNTETNYLVVDPDDYQRTKKLESIHKARQEVLNVRNNRMDLINEYKGMAGPNRNGVDIYGVKLGKTVAQYGSELLPLIEDGLRNGAVDEKHLEVSLGQDSTDMDIIAYIKADGRIQYDGELICPPGPNHLAIYRQLDRIQRELGLGLELEEQKGPAEI